MTDSLIVGVPEEDRAELVLLSESLRQPSEILKQSNFDGVSFLELAVHGVQAAGASTVVWATVRTWLITRAERLKHTRIIIPGQGSFEGASAREVMKIIKLVDELSKSDGSV
jgi:hypothetical protein